MSSTARIVFGVIALAILAGMACVCFNQDAVAIRPVAAAPTPDEVPSRRPVAPVAAKVLPAEPPMPFDMLPTVANRENRIIYTTSSLGEPMEVHPDGLVVIRDHRTVLRYGDGREEVRFITMRARPARAMAPVLDEDPAPRR